MDTWSILRLLNSFAAMLLTLLFLYKQSGSKGIKLVFACSGALILGFIASTLDFPKSASSQIAVYALMVFYAVTAFDGKIYMRLLFGLVPPLLLFACDRIADALMYFVTPANISAISSLSAASYEREILYVFLCILTFIPLATIRNRDNRHVPLFQRMLLILLLAAGIAAMALLTMAIVTMSSRYAENPVYEAVRMCIFAIATILFMYIGVIFLFYNTADMYKKNYEMTMKAQMQELERAHDENIRETYETMRTWKHDMKNHIRTIRTLAENGSSDEIIAYVDESFEKMDAVMGYISTGHPAIDATLSNKLYAAKNAGLNVQTMISMPEKLPLSSVDTCAILSNLLDNAIRAAQETAEGTIRLEINVKGRMLCIRIENSCSGEYNIEDGILLSTKTTGDGHGLGLRSVQKITETCGGSMRIVPEKERFTVTVMLPLEKGDET